MRETNYKLAFKYSSLMIKFFWISIKLVFKIIF